MNREIKFRAFIKEIFNTNGEMIFGDEDLTEDGYFIINNKIFRGCYDYYTGMSYYEVKGYVMQYTGLIDKNSKEIYEGDIIETEDWIGKIEFVDGGFCLNITKNKTKALSYDIGQYPPIDEFISGRFTEIEIKGNVFQNPELCGGKN